MSPSMGRGQLGSGRIPWAPILRSTMSAGPVSVRGWPARLKPKAPAPLSLLGPGLTRGHTRPRADPVAPHLVWHGTVAPVVTTERDTGPYYHPFFWGL